MRRKLEAEAEANQILTEARQQAEAATKKANRRNVFSLIGAAAAVTVAAIAVPTSLKAGSDRDLARQEMERAKQEKTAAQRLTQLEQSSASALRQSEKRPIQALVGALETGQQLQMLVNQKAQGKDAVLVNQKLALTEYPTLRPIYSLNQILSTISNREIPARQGRVNSVSWSSDGQTLATGGQDGSVKLWSRSGEPLKTIDAQQVSVIDVSWSSDGQTLATGGRDGSVKLCSRSGEPLKTIDAQQAGVNSVSWSSDGQTLATGGDDGSVKLWSRSGELLKTIDAQQVSVNSVRWSSDGQTLTTGGRDGSVKLWLTEDLDALLTRGCRWFNIYLIGTPQVLQKLTVCQTPALLHVAAPNLVEDSEALASQGNVDRAIAGFRTAQRWNPSLKFDPVARANELAQAAKFQTEVDKLQTEIDELLVSNQADRALTKLREAITLNPGFPISEDTVGEFMREKL